jgi:hypothetical protein
MSKLPRSSPPNKARRRSPAKAPPPPARKPRLSPKKAAERAAHAAWLEQFAGELETLARVVHDREVLEYVAAWEQLEAGQPSPDPFQRARETKGVASVALAFRVLQDVLPLGTALMGAIPPAALKLVEAIVRAAYPRVTFAQLVIDLGPGTTPEVLEVLSGRTAAP